MSKVEYIQCDGKECNNMVQDESEARYEGWVRITKLEKECDFDLCPYCARKALEAVGLE